MSGNAYDVTYAFLMTLNGKETTTMTTTTTTTSDENLRGMDYNGGADGTQRPLSFVLTRRISSDKVTKFYVAATWYAGSDMTDTTNTVERDYI